MSVYDFSVATREGGRVSLEDYRGKVLLHRWAGGRCSPLAHRHQPRPSVWQTPPIKTTDRKSVV